MYSHLILGLIACLAGLCVGQTAEDGWTVSTFPDPIDNPALCGRQRSSFVCDPDEVLDPVKANTIDEVLRGIYNETRVPCYNEGPRATRMKGYLVMVAVMKKLKKYHTVNSTDSLSSMYREAMHFAYHLGKDQKWGKHSSQCNDMVIIVFSASGPVLYTSTQSTARRMLTDNLVRDTLLQTLTFYHPLTTRNSRVGDGLKYMATRYSMILKGEVNEDN